MKYFFFSFHFLYFFFILKLIDFTCNQNLEEYYCGKIKESDNDNNENAAENDCVCDMTIGMCDYLCCCDTDCDKSEIESWINQTKCIDQKDTVGIFADRCIDRHLVVFYNKRRGLKRENQTEDIRKIENKTILNYCFSMDNSGKMTKNITSIESYFTENGIDFNEETIQYIGNSIYDNIYKINNNTSQNDDQSDNQKEANTQKYLKFDSTYKGDYFKKSDFFSLYSSSSCQNSKNVELFKSENYSCIMNTGFSITEDILTRIKFESKESTQCSISNRYCVDEGLLTYNAQSQCKDDTIIVEVEFLLKIEKTEIKDCSINIVRAPDEGNYRIFKNSVIFTNIKNTIPYRYSGNGGYLNNFPLKVYSANKKKVFNEFFIVGRNIDGDCRYDPETDIYNYLYNIDKPLYFKQDYTYSCKLDKNKPLKSTTLYQKISDITKIAKYGSSSYINADKEDNPDWITVDKSNLNENDKYIKMNIYIKKKKQGFYSFKVIDKVIISSSSDNSVDSELKLDIKFEDSDDENNESKYNKEPEKPLFIPNIPEDILDPLFYSDVDK